MLFLVKPERLVDLVQRIEEALCHRLSKDLKAGVLFECWLFRSSHEMLDVTESELHESFKVFQGDLGQMGTKFKCISEPIDAPLG